MKLGNLFSLGKALFGGDHRSKNHSNAVSIFVNILVVLKRTPLLLSPESVIKKTAKMSNEHVSTEGDIIHDRTRFRIVGLACNHTMDRITF